MKEIRLQDGMMEFVVSGDLDMVDTLVSTHNIPGTFGMICVFVRTEGI